MKTFWKYVACAAVALATMVSGAHAAPLGAAKPAAPAAHGLVTLVGGSQHYGSRANQTPIYGVNRRFSEKRIKRGYYNGFRGYRHARKGYREHRGYWYPRSAFSFQLHIAPRVHRPHFNQASRHVSWCANRYRTYRVSDNTYVPRAGHRAHCRSPYRR